MSGRTALSTRLSKRLSKRLPARLPARLPVPRSSSDAVIDVLRRLRAGDLDARCGPLPGPAGRLAAEVDALAEQLTALVLGVTGSIDLLNSGGEDLFMASALLGSGTEVAAEQIGVVTEATHRIVAEISSVATGTRAVADSTAELTRDLERSRQASDAAGERVRGSVEIGERLQASAAGIESVVSVISKIASQTKLLALNAEIESARAGAAGLGFAVVAQEVKRLADETQGATNEIGARIGSIVQDARAASEALGDIHLVVEAAHSLQRTTAMAVEEQSSVVEGIARAAGVAGEGARAIETAVDAADSAMRDVTSASSGIQEQAMRIMGMAGELTRISAQVRPTESAVEAEDLA